MKKFKKVIAICLTAITIVSCMSFSTSAADNPDYLYNEMQPRGNTRPGANGAYVDLPNSTGSFSYNFTNQTKQYSDFLIVPLTSTTGIRMLYKATSASHDVTLKVIAVSDRDVVFSETVTILNGFEQESWVSFTDLESGKAYYIELSNPSVSGAKGTFTITD